jgi:hypothetical protein
MMSDQEKNDLRTLMNAIRLGQARGVFSIEQAAELAPTLQRITEYLKTS